jgi:invasion protein IalB
MNETQQPAMLFGIAAVLFLLGLIIGWAGHGLASPTTRDATAASYGSWSLSCPSYKEAKSHCELSTPVVDGASKVTVANIAIGQAQDGMKLVVNFPLQINLMLAPGMGLVIGSDPMRTVQYATCTVNGCMAIVPFDDKLRQSMRSARDAKLIFAVPTKDRKPISITFPLGSFSEADDAMSGQENIRQSWFRRLWS